MEFIIFFSSISEIYLSLSILIFVFLNLISEIQVKQINTKKFCVFILVFFLVLFFLGYSLGCEQDNFRLLVQCKAALLLPKFEPKTTNIVKLWFHRLVRSTVFQIILLISCFSLPYMLLTPYSSKPLEFATICVIYVIIFLATWVREKITAVVQDQSKRVVILTAFLSFFFYFVFVFLFLGTDGVIIRLVSLSLLLALVFLSLQYEGNYSKFIAVWFPNWSFQRKRRLENEQIIELHRKCDLPWVDFFFHYSDNSIFAVFFIAISNTVSNFFRISGGGQTYCWALLALYIVVEVLYDYYILFGCNPVVETSFISRVTKVLVKHGYKAAIVGAGVCIDHPVEVAKQIGQKPVLAVQNFVGAVPCASIADRTANFKLRAISEIIPIDNNDLRIKGSCLQLDTEVINTLDKNIKAGMNPVYAKVLALNSCEQGPKAFSFEGYNTIRSTSVREHQDPSIILKNGKFVKK